MAPAPALFTRTSKRPQVLTALATVRAASSCGVTRAFVGSPDLLGDPIRPIRVVRLAEIIAHDGHFFDK
jgi:hypothetical protein